MGVTWHDNGSTVRRPLAPRGYPDPAEPEARLMTTFPPPARLTTASLPVTAAALLVAAYGATAGITTLRAVTADWLTPDEADLLAPLAAGLAHVLQVSAPEHRGRPCPFQVTR